MKLFGNTLGPLCVKWVRYQLCYAAPLKNQKKTFYLGDIARQRFGTRVITRDSTTEQCDFKLKQPILRAMVVVSILADYSDDTSLTPAGILIFLYCA